MKTRFIASVVAASKAPAPSLPCKRGQRRKLSERHAAAPTQASKRT